MIKPNSAFPVFIVQNLDETKPFYSSYFGFGVAFENEWYLHLVSESGIQVGFMLPSQPHNRTYFIEPMMEMESFSVLRWMMRI